MKKIYLSLLIPLLCSCTAPELATKGDIRCLINSGDEFVIPAKDRGTPEIASWVRHNNAASYSLTFTEYAPEMTLNFSNRITVFFYHDSIHVSPVSFRQYTRKRTAEDDKFYHYLKSIAPQKTNH